MGSGRFQTCVAAAAAVLVCCRQPSVVPLSLTHTPQALLHSTALCMGEVRVVQPTLSVVSSRVWNRELENSLRIPLAVGVRGTSGEHLGPTTFLSCNNPSAT